PAGPRTAAPCPSFPATRGWRRARPAGSPPAPPPARRPHPSAPRPGEPPLSRSPTRSHASFASPLPFFPLLLVTHSRRQRRDLPQADAIEAGGRGADAQRGGRLCNNDCLPGSRQISCGCYRRSTTIRRNAYAQLGFSGSMGLWQYGKRIELQLRSFLNRSRFAFSASSGGTPSFSYSMMYHSMPPTPSAAVMIAVQSSSSAPRYALGFFFENGLTCIEIVRPAFRSMNDWGVTPSASDAFPVSSCSTTSFEV